MKLVTTAAVLFVSQSLSAADTYVGHVVQLVVGLTTGDRIIYDFEPGPQDKDDRKKGGWQGFFKNQGQCVGYFERTIPD